MLAGFVTRYALPALLTLALALGGYAWRVQSQNAALRAEIETLRGYVTGRTEADEAVNNLPDDPDGVLRRLCETARTPGPICGDLGRGTASGD